MEGHLIMAMAGEYSLCFPFLPMHHEDFDDDDYDNG